MEDRAEVLRRPRDLRMNLLPWRERLRQEQKRKFLGLLLLMPLLAGMMIGGLDRHYVAAIQRQEMRNNFLAEEIKILDGRVEEVTLLTQQREQLLARMAVIQDLQENRASVVRVFDELAQHRVAGVFFTELSFKSGFKSGAEQSATEVTTITGVTRSNDQIALFLRNVSTSPWFEQPRVTAIKADASLGAQASRFTLRLDGQ